MQGALRELGERGLDDQLRPAGRSPRPALASKRGDFICIEHACPAIRLTATGKYAPADIRIEARGLDAQAVGSLGGADPLRHAAFPPDPQSLRATRALLAGLPPARTTVTAR